MIKGHIETIKKINRELIINTVRMNQPISRSAIAKNLSLSKSTVSSIVNELVDQHIIQELGYSSSTKEGGRRPIQLGFNANAGYIIGIDLKATYIQGYLTDLNGNIIVDNELPIEGEMNQSKIINFINSLLDNENININKLLAIGCSVPGMVNTLKGLVIEAPELGWKDIPIAKWISEHFNCSIFINNNVNCLAMAEKWSGNADEYENFIYIYIGYGIGSAIIANNSLITGVNFTAGEIGYFTYPKDNLTRKNKYGEFGIYDNKVSILAFKDKSKETIKNLTYNQLDSQEKAIFDDMMKNLSFGIGNIISLLNPEKIIIGGELAKLISSNISNLDELVQQVTPIPFQLECSKMSRKSASLGSISLALDKIPELI